MKNIKKIIFSLYLFYTNNIKIKTGKYRIGKILFSILGRSLYEINGIKLHLNPLPLIENKLMTAGSHDGDVEKLIYKKLKNKGIFIDIGANIGYFSLLAAKNKKINVFSYEPSRRERNHFYENLKENDFNNITIFPFALSDKEEIAKINIARDWNPGLNSIVNNLEAECVYIDEVQCYPFSTIFPEKLLNDVQLVKIDVEGFEMNVLKGMEELIDKMKNADFIVEINDDFLKNAGSSSKQIHAFFKKHGYKSEGGNFDVTFTRVT